ncbi:hypothetical protein EXU48_11515 [Occultella glacieicola]|uniref:Uncharacterized protein n=1 Tax=Occultella glacieicola TaxID=2518684 RepID=A0ABY2E3J7_9MICO|nr:hypothetical protein [Occultella glacieicola]TDE94075.1 hypothetical protein EXU48_11515 [Occultella glacieicola]
MGETACAWVCDLDHVMKLGDVADAVVTEWRRSDWTTPDDESAHVTGPGGAGPGWVIVPMLHRDAAGDTALAALPNISRS